jgi:hypothetical protein
MKVQLWREDDKVGEVLFNEDTGNVTADMPDPNDQAQVESVIAAAQDPTTWGTFGSGEMEEIAHDRDPNWFNVQILGKLEGLGYTHRTIEKT